jgi:uncharacterized membrane protein YuzA (DUF378 family)
MTRLNTLDWIALILVIIGGLNWGLVGFFNWNLVHAIFGSVSWLERLIYAIVGLAALYVAVISPKLHKNETAMR